jgi:PleD family two-component response regulator
MTDAMRSNNREPQHSVTDATMPVDDGVEPARRLLNLARDQIAHHCLNVYVAQRSACVVLDLDIHGPAALDACRKIRARQNASDVTVILITALRSVEVFDAALLAGADEILLRPLTDTELIERVKDALMPLRYSGAELRRRCERLCQQRAQLERAQRAVGLAEPTTLISNRARSVPRG